MVLVGGASRRKPLFLFRPAVRAGSDWRQKAAEAGPYICGGGRVGRCVGEKRRQGCRCDRRDDEVFLGLQGLKLVRHMVATCKGYSQRRAWTASTLAARAAGTAEAIRAATRITPALAIRGRTPGIWTSVV